jgi:hypothetical protein
MNKIAIPFRLDHCRFIIVYTYKNQMFTKTMKYRINKRHRCLRKKCAKEWTIKTRKQGEFNKSILKKCNKKPCDYLNKCVANNPQLKNINTIDQFGIELDKLCTIKMRKQCDKYYNCSQKIAKQTGYQKSVLNLIECGDKMCAN